MSTPADVLRRLLEGVADNERAELAELYAEDAMVDRPVAGVRLEGPAQVRRRYAHAGEVGVDIQAEDGVTHETTHS